MESVWPVSKLSTKSVSSRRELVANCVHTGDAEATKQFRRDGVGGVYWALACHFVGTIKRPNVLSGQGENCRQAMASFRRNYQ